MLAHALLPFLLTRCERMQNKPALETQHICCWLPELTYCYLNASNHSDAFVLLFVSTGLDHCHFGNKKKFYKK